MSVEIKKIVVGLDGSEKSFNALKEALNWAKRLEAEIIAVHVLPIPSEFVDLGGMIIEIEAELRKEGEAILERGAEEAKKEGVPYTGVLLEGNAPESIANYAEEYDVDLLIVGYQGKSMLSELIMGSVTSKLLNISKVPVLVVK
ncbi:UspA domain-containing protein [Thermodesulfatator indicus DSM 15286]|uniref:UspA domain-containing protein n=1 Tax=Thermodesulfatator indicus (strain DSM 15286 / JCM 11887 / CIR29812) TaxID=667014 RepID=F8AAG9_THEID|nr:universal stress protein [Thermodesulfatator indicus]AEH45389.1 UspA domain-containing protein [Thermodesulfatator indicus DSM 15286]